MERSRLLVVTPHFPPISAPDMHRVRLSLPYFEEFSWTPTVLAAAPTQTELCEPLLVETLPAGLSVERVGAVPASLSRVVGVGNLGLRAWPFLYTTGRRLIAERKIDLVYFSTTAFFTMPLGRLWKREFGTPFVLDFQDPWFSDYYETHEGAQAPPKYGLARGAHGVLEKWTLKEASGIVSVSSDYIDVLERRYPDIRNVPSITLPFGASRADFEVLDRCPQPNRHFRRDDDRVHGVYAGRGGDDLSVAVEILSRALAVGLVSSPEVFDPVALHFVGTDYSPAGSHKTIEPVAARFGVGARVFEDPARVPYFQALQLLKDADFLVVVGSDDPSYNASKIYPYILAGKPLLAIVHERSPLVDLLRETRAGAVVTFTTLLTEEDKADTARRLTDLWRAALAPLGRHPDTDWVRFERYTAREMARRQCALFDNVLDRHDAAVA